MKMTRKNEPNKFRNTFNQIDDVSFRSFRSFNPNIPDGQIVVLRRPSVSLIPFVPFSCLGWPLSSPMTGPDQTASSRRPVDPLVRRFVSRWPKRCSRPSTRTATAPWTSRKRLARRSALLVCVCRTKRGGVTLEGLVVDQCWLVHAGAMSFEVGQSNLIALFVRATCCGHTHTQLSYDQTINSFACNLA